MSGEDSNGHIDDDRRSDRPAWIAAAAAVFAALFALLGIWSSSRVQSSVEDLELRLDAMDRARTAPILSIRATAAASDVNSGLVRFDIRAANVGASAARGCSLLVDNKNEIGGSTTTPVRLLGPVVDFDLEPGERRDGISVEFSTSVAPGSYDVQVTGACATPDTGIIDGNLNVVMGDEGPLIWGYSEELSQVSTAE